MQHGVGGFTLKTPLTNRLMTGCSDMSVLLGRVIILLSELRAEHIAAQLSPCSNKSVRKTTTSSTAG